MGLSASQTLAAAVKAARLPVRATELGVRHALGAVSTAARLPVQVADAGVSLAADAGIATVRLGVRAADAGVRRAAAVAPAPARATLSIARAGIDRVSPVPLAQLREDLAILVDPHIERVQRRVAVGTDRATIEVRGLTSGRNTRVVRALEEQLDRLDAVKWWRINAVTGRVVAGLNDVRAELPDLLAAVDRIEDRTEVADQTWSRAVEHPADREPVLAAAIELAGDATAVLLATAGGLLPFGGPLRLLRAAAVLADNQPRLREFVTERLGRTRADLVLTLATALGNAATESVAKLVLDTAQRSFILAEAASAHRQWQCWEAELADRAQAPVADPLPPHQRPAPLPPGPVERVADETAGGALAGALALATGRRFEDAFEALELGAPKAAHASRESYAATLAALMARSGVLTLHPQAWRRLDRLSTLVVDGEALLTAQRVVLEAEARHNDWPDARVWSAAQRLLWSDDPPADDPAGLRLVHPESGTPDRGATRRAVWRELRDGDAVVGRVLVGRELDRRAHGVLEAARAAGLRVVLSAGQDAEELRSLTDQFVAAGISLSKLVEGMQRDGHVVGVLGARAFKALEWADVAIGVVGAEHGEVRVPWTADVVCRDLPQVLRILAAIGPARQVSERGRALALSACALGGLMLAVSPRRGQTSPLVAAHCAALFNGALTGWRVARTTPRARHAPLLPWHALEPGEALARLPEPAALADRTQAQTPGRPALFAPIASVADFTGHVRRELADPLTPLLGVGAIATAILGSPADAMLLSSVLTVNALVSARQRQRAEQALHQLLEDEQLTARLIARETHDSADPDETRIPAELLLVGDLIALDQGDVVPADARLLRADDLEVDESGLTGESVTVDKAPAATPGAPLGERACMVFEGSTVVNGSALAVVVAVGADTQAGRAAAGAVPPEKGGVQAQLRKLTDQALPLTLTGGTVVALLGGLRGQTLRSAIADGVAVAVAAVPEGLPLVATVAQLAAARRLSRYGVLVRASRTVEALGRVDTLCFDKTGTLTEGRLRLTTVADLDEQWTPDADSRDARRLLRAAARACPDPADGPVHHATDRAVLEAAEAALGDDAHLWDPIDEIPFDSHRGYAAALGHTTRKLRLIVKGAPEVVVPRCTRARAANGTAREMDSATRERAGQVVHDLAAQGLRVLVVARRDLADTPADVAAAVGELTLLGFIGLADTPRPQTLPLVTALRDSGISVRMITGDHPVTATAVAEQLGIDAEHVTTGADLDRLDDTAQTELIERSCVFARVNPEQKVRIVAALRRGGHVVGMTGDGSNDAAAIRTADVGIGMAAHGSSAARNAADLVLTRPEPTALLDALIEGRGMWRRVTDAVGVLVGGNAGEVAFTVYGTAIGGQAPLGTRQFLLVNMLTDMFPALALALSRGGEDTAADPADAAAHAERRAAELAEVPPAQLGPDLWRTLAVRGIATATGASTAWTIARYTGTRRRAATVGLVALIGTQLGQTLLAARHSPLVWVTTAASGAVLATIVMTPGLCTYFGCTPLGPLGWTTAIGSATAATLGAAVIPHLLPGNDSEAAAAQEPATCDTEPA